MRQVKIFVIAALALALGLFASHSLMSHLGSPDGVTDQIQLGDYSQVLARYDQGAALVLFTNAGCPYCEMARDHLDQRELVYHEVRLEQSSSERQYFMRDLGLSTVPVLISSERLVTGYKQPLYDSLFREE
ncbi:glutaredoxin family protein [Novilysobacter defluvii]|uniref:Glutaredoxin domain-containing protein n=1 Tax=Lysobacter defluvii IMMIB APB-9 = DSM 18482 TaxID=1385515 RepID=A0A0A0MBK7_9GAMM|nr:glutaredoxin family protein [Lysobacter defluvii]KGO99787.1 hypothetical protein N791_13865 [Lysobacter defluvii IMMIB APB-9 = DSM 18482]